MGKSVDIEKTIGEALQRSKSYVFYDPIEETSYVICNDIKDRLSMDEEILIKGWFSIHLPGHKVVFTNGNAMIPKKRTRKELMERNRALNENRRKRLAESLNNRKESANVQT